MGGKDEQQTSEKQNLPPHPQFPFPPFSSTGNKEGEQQNMPTFPQFPFPSMGGQGGQNSFPFPPFPKTGDNEGEQQNMPQFPQFPFPSMGGQGGQNSFPFPPFPSSGNKEGEQQNMPPFPFPPQMGNFPFPGFPKIQKEDADMLDYLHMQDLNADPSLRECPKVCDLTTYPECSCLHPAAYTKDGRGNCNVGSIKPDLQVWCYVDPDKGNPEVVCPDAKKSSSKEGY